VHLVEKTEKSGKFFISVIIAVVGGAVSMVIRVKNALATIKGF